MSSSVIGPDPAVACSGSGIRWSKLLPLPADAPREPSLKSPPPSPRPPSRIRSLATTSVMYFFWPLVLSSQERVCRRPSIYTLPPFFRYSPAISARRCQSTTLCHSVRSCHSPALSLKRSLVAMVSLATGVPCGVYLISGSFPRLPISRTRFRLFPAMGCSFAGVHYSRVGSVEMVRTVTSIGTEYHFGQASCAIVMGASLMTTVGVEELVGSLERRTPEAAA